MSLLPRRPAARSRADGLRRSGHGVRVCGLIASPHGRRRRSAKSPSGYVAARTYDYGMTKLPLKLRAMRVLLSVVLAAAALAVLVPRQLGDPALALQDAVANALATRADASARAAKTAPPSPLAVGVAASMVAVTALSDVDGVGAGGVVAVVLATGSGPITPASRPALYA